MFECNYSHVLILSRGSDGVSRKDLIDDWVGEGWQDGWSVNSVHMLLGWWESPKKNVHLAQVSLQWLSMLSKGEQSSKDQCTQEESLMDA